MDQTLDKYLDCIMSYANRNKSDAAKVRSELEDHLYKKIDDLKTQGLSQSEAVFKAIEDHGQPWTIGYKLQKKRFTARTFVGIVCLLIVVFSVLVVLPPMGRIKHILYPQDDNVIVFAGPNAQANLQIEPGKAIKVISSNGQAGIYDFSEALILGIGLPFMALLCIALLGVFMIFKRTKKIKPVLA
jgi:hypothetical protein